MERSEKFYSFQSLSEFFWIQTAGRRDIGKALVRLQKRRHRDRLQGYCRIEEECGVTKELKIFLFQLTGFAQNTISHLCPSGLSRT